MKFAVRIIKNQFYPLKISDGANLRHGQMVLVRTEKGEEAHKVFLVNSEIQKQWEKFKPEPIPFVRTMNERDLAELDEIKKLEIQALYKCRELAEKRKLGMNLVQTRYT